MTADFDAVVDALAEAWAAWADVGRSLDAAAWRAPTRVEGWDVTAVFAHASRFPEGLIHRAADRRDGKPDWATAVDLLRFFNQPAGLATTAAPRVREAAVADAVGLAPAALVPRFADGGPPSIAALREAGPVTVEYFIAGSIPLGEAARLALLEATVHLLDVLRALDRDPAIVPAAALEITCDLLAAMTPAVDLVEAATGRTSTSPFPVLR